MENHILQAFKSAQSGLNALIDNPKTIRSISEAAEVLIHTLNHGGKLYSCGNGGSMCDAMHFAEEFTGRFRKNRKSIGAVAISDPSFLSCAANDFGYDQVFSRFIEGVGIKGDVLFAISTSGNSPNIINAVAKSKELGLKSIVLTGKKDCNLGKMADIHIPTPVDTPYSDRVQELHIKCIHILVELCERSLFPHLYGS